VDADLGRLPSEIEICLFRVVQECLTNVYRHSGSESCSIAICRESKHLCVEVCDTGHGMRNPADGQMHAGVGLRGIQERLRPFGGTLQVQSSEKGTTVTVLVPISTKSEA
jgi:two-component system NarL family sensor kinase